MDCNTNNRAPLMVILLIFVKICSLIDEAWSCFFVMNFVPYANSFLKYWKRDKLKSEKSNSI